MPDRIGFGERKSAAELTMTARQFRRVTSDGGGDTLIERQVAIERPIALEFNGIGYAVMMATPSDLIDFATGFALSERLVDAADQIVDVVAFTAPNGEVVRTTLAANRAEALIERARHRASESSCGMCGIENLEQAMRPLPRVTSTTEVSSDQIFTAVDALRDRQPLNRATGAVHAAAWCAADGSLRMVREDVGRHNAFDKLIGAKARAGKDWEGGFALLSSRCSYELVEKAVLANCPLLVTISAPTELAIERAASAGLRLIVLARSDALLELANAA